MRGLILVTVVALLLGCAGAELSAAKTDDMGTKPNVQMSDQPSIKL